MPDTDAIPDFYSDQVLIFTNLWGVAMTFGKLPAQPPGAGPGKFEPEPQVTVRMSLQHAKAMAMLIRKNLKGWERNNMEIALPQAAYESLNLAPDDW